MKLTTSLFTIFLLLFFSCGQIDPDKQTDEGNVKGEIYESKEIGWSIEIPKDWSIISKDKLENYDQKGKDVIEKVAGTEITNRGLKYLICFQKDQSNIFASTSEPYKEEFPGDYKKNTKAVNELCYQTLVKQGIKTDTFSGKETIQGLEFNAFYTTIYAPDDKIILNQIFYSRLINGFDFGVNINYNNEQDKRTMIDAWKKSKFYKK